MTISGGEVRSVLPISFLDTILYYKSSTKWPNASHSERSERHAAGNRSCVMLLLWVSCCLREYCVVGQGQSYPEAECKLSYKRPKQRCTLFGPCFVRCGSVVSLELVMGLGEGKGVAALNMYDGG